MTELTDSGVSVVSDVSLPVNKDMRLLSRFKEAEKKVDSKHCSRHGKKYGSRSGSLERPNRETWSMGVPAQPFVADPGMPPLTPPPTVNIIFFLLRMFIIFFIDKNDRVHLTNVSILQVIQLEETRRRLMEENRSRASCKQRHFNVSKQAYEPASQNQSYVQSNQSTLRKPKQDAGDFTIVVFSFCDEQFPYRTKIPGHNVTLKQFKEYLPKKGSYRCVTSSIDFIIIYNLKLISGEKIIYHSFYCRYFFKTECEDLDTKVIQEEIMDDTEVLPLWEGKVMAQVKALE